MLVEARNFPELAQFYVDEVIQPTHELIGRLVQQGIDRGRVPACADCRHHARAHFAAAADDAAGAFLWRLRSAAPGVGAPEMLDAQMSCC